MNSVNYKAVAFVSCWKDKYKSPFEAYVSMVNHYIEYRNMSPALKEQAEKQYKEGYSVQDILLNEKGLRFIVCKDHRLLHKEDESKVLIFA